MVLSLIHVYFYEDFKGLFYIFVTTFIIRYISLIQIVLLFSWLYQDC